MKTSLFLVSLAVHFYTLVGSEGPNDYCDMTYFSGLVKSALFSFPTTRWLREVSMTSPLA